MQSRATWEPAENLSSDEPLHSWQEKKMRVTRGLAEPFDIDSWTAQQDEIEAAKARRRRARRAKRLRLDPPVSEDEAKEVSDGAASPESSDDDVSIINARRPRKEAGSPDVIVIDDDEGPEPAKQNRVKKGTARVIKDTSAKPPQPDKQKITSKASASRQDSASKSTQLSREPAAPTIPSAKVTSARTLKRPSTNSGEKAAPAMSTTVKKSAMATVTTSATSEHLFLSYVLRSRVNIGKSQTYLLAIRYVHMSSLITVHMARVLGVL